MVAQRRGEGPGLQPEAEPRSPDSNMRFTSREKRISPGQALVSAGPSSSSPRASIIVRRGATSGRSPSPRAARPSSPPSREVSKYGRCARLSGGERRSFTEPTIQAQPPRLVRHRLEDDAREVGVVGAPAAQRRAEAGRGRRRRVLAEHRALLHALAHHRRARQLRQQRRTTCAPSALIRRASERSVPTPPLTSSKLLSLFSPIPHFVLFPFQPKTSNNQHRRIEKERSPRPASTS